MADHHDLVLTGGRVLDPETGLDAVADVGVTGGVITAVSRTPGALRGRDVLDVTGLAVAPGWIDLHSHAQTVAGHRLQAMDGVTTALELEAGATPVAEAYARAAAEGRPINYGFSASWAQARMAAVGGIPPGGGIAATLAHIGDPRWQAPATGRALDDLLGLLRRDLADGALGIGVLMGYAPGVDPAEYVAVAALAAEAGVPTYTHARDLVEREPATLIDGAEELTRTAAATGAHMHYCHVNSTSTRHIDKVLALVDKVRAEGAKVSTEAYPYGAGMTGIGANFLAPERLPALGITPDAIVYALTGERVADAARLAEIRATDPGGLAIIHTLDEDDPADLAYLDRALLANTTVIGSDAMPLTWTGTAQPDPLAWPLPPAAITHPRAAGTFSKVLRRYVRETGALTLLDAVARCSLLPARVLEQAVPAMRRKGRVQEGCDADLAVFDPQTVSDQATYAHSTRPSTGYRHVLVAGRFVVKDAELQQGAYPGRPIRR
ncbi:N-acyl-D-aspartate/D-glutamate deacylase [Thermocatellispora tengchongensis]|uniref:N-acyl-D-aspartate/D-glutamate deacylase n=1 Tax=Thermocatellispora tengchongensis TaxID=1073253 RepID=A0A840NZC3_9ACTN|nr:amidohydrolase family protein [Thermocatellispora tengchongensis]MBB5130357.1 N-acyl-D-aspartate/D-glutamate deacylase [Thermocatellispora tengchongensis]